MSKEVKFDNSRDVIERIELPGPYQVDLVLTVHPDYDSSPDDSECYDESDIDAYGRGEWGYVGYVVAAYRDGVELGSDAIWGTEHGFIGGRYYGSAEWIDEAYYILDLIAMATREAQTTIAKLTYATM